MFVVVVVVVVSVAIHKRFSIITFNVHITFCNAVLCFVVFTKFAKPQYWKYKFLLSFCMNTRTICLEKRKSELSEHKTY